MLLSSLFFSADDKEMIACKAGNWWETNPQRGRANNSAVLLRHKVTKEFFLDLWKRVEASNAGEPGIYLSNDKDWGTNPCCEIGLRPFQFCNLTEVNVSNITGQNDLEQRVRAATFYRHTPSRLHRLSLSPSSLAADHREGCPYRCVYDRYRFGSCASR